MGENIPQAQVLMSPEKSIPKFCTGMRINQIENGDLIISFFNQDATKDAPLVLIETVIMTPNHGQKVVDALTKVLNNK